MVSFRKGGRPIRPPSIQTDRRAIRSLRSPPDFPKQGILATANAREPLADGEFLTAGERAELDAADAMELDDLIEDPIPLVPVAQLYRRDIPDYAGPDGTDLLQVLWCPLDHSDRHYSPRVFLHWRDSTAVGPLLAQPPEPAALSDMYLPVPSAAPSPSTTRRPPRCSEARGLVFRRAERRVGLVPQRVEV